MNHDSTIIGEPDRQLCYWEHQGKADNCAVVSEMSIINQFGYELTQDEANFISASHGWYHPGGGTAPDDIGQMMDMYNIPNHTCTNATVDNLARELQAGHGVIVGGVCGGFILKLTCVEGYISNVVAYKNSGVNTRPVFLKANEEPTSIGWGEFSDSRSLLQNEIFKIESAEYSNIVGQMLHNESSSDIAENTQNQYPATRARIKPWILWIGVLILMGMIRSCSK